MDNLLQIVQDISDNIQGIARPSTVVGSTDDQVREILAILNKEGRVLTARHNWEKNTKEVVFTAASATSQGTLTSITSAVNGGGSGFAYIYPETVWNRTLNRPVFGPLSAKNWQLLKSAQVTGPYPEYRIRGGEFITIPLLTSGDSVAFEFKSKHFCESSSATASYSRWNADTDVPILDSNLYVLGAIWRWRKSKGVDYAEEFNDYEREVKAAISRDGGKTSIRMDAGRERRPGVYVPDGNWTGS